MNGGLTSIKVVSCSNVTKQGQRKKVSYAAGSFHCRKLLHSWQNIVGVSMYSKCVFVIMRRVSLKEKAIN